LWSSKAICDVVILHFVLLRQLQLLVASVVVTARAFGCLCVTGVVVLRSIVRLVEGLILCERVSVAVGV